MPEKDQHQNDPGDDGYLAQLLMEAREEVLHADSKASIILAGLGVGVGAILGGIIASDWEPSDLSNRFEWIWWVGVLALAFAVVTSAASVWPRFRPQDKGSGAVYFWGDTRDIKGSSELLNSLEKKPLDMSARNADQFLALSEIVITKYTLIRRALLSAGAGATLCAIAVILNGL